MRASDFILQARDDLQEKSEHWSEEGMLIKLQRAYIALQFDLPYFIVNQTLDIKEGKSEYYLTSTPLKNVMLKIAGEKFNYLDIENFYITSKKNQYTFNEDMLIINSIPVKDSAEKIVYKYQKVIETLNCEVELPVLYHKALRLLLMSEIHEKPLGNTKLRNLNTHYLKLYALEIKKLKTEQNTRPRNITSNYQKV